MNTYITYDYEIFFGHNHGTIEKSLLYPTEQILAIAEKHQAKFTFFIDCGFIIKLREYKDQFQELERQYQLVTEQIKKIKNQGHDCQLHIHPHWEKTIYNGERWEFNYDYYKLSDFNQDEIIDIFRRYTEELKNITNESPTAFRAGGWCIQPFDQIKPAFLELGIKLDSSVFSGGKNIISPYYYDYTTAPSKDFWKFENDVCKAEEKGSFIEVPISSYHYSPLFFWRLFILGNTLPKSHKPIGDGKPMPSSITRKKMLTQTHFMSASVDGYFISKAEEILKRNQKQNDKHTVLLGHPKAATHYSLHQLDKLIQRNKSWCNFISFSMFKES